jgi:putative tricarboxylic transport membrane protein
MTTLASITILLFGLFGVRPLLLVLKVKRSVLMPIVFLLCTVGAFASASRLFDIYAMMTIGIGAFFLRRRGYEMAPLVLGLVLGPLLDKSLRRGLVLSATVTIFTILLYVPPFKAAVKRVTGAVGGAIGSVLGRRT